MDGLIICIFKAMQWKRIRPWLLPLLLAVFIKIFSFFPHLVEKYYSTGVYPWISRVLRILFGWIPFSMGDILYAAVFIYGLFSVIRFVTRAFRRQLHRSFLMLSLKRLLAEILWVYLIFNIFWGLNYDRMPLGSRLGLEEKMYSKDELKTLVGLMVSRMNETDSASRRARPLLAKIDTVFQHSIQAYCGLSREYPSISYPNPSVKFSFYGYLMNYMGFSGYYNPFSGEAQVNTTIPTFVQPFVSCHEIGHQLGYAKEEEANFCGFLATKTSSDPAFRYSVYLDIYLYSANALYLLDSTAFIPYRESLKPSVRQDLRDLRSFYQKYQNPFEPLLRRMYGDYLKANRQPQGLNAYDEVIGLAIAYYRKYGADAF